MAGKSKDKKKDKKNKNEETASDYLRRGLFVVRCRRRCKSRKPLEKLNGASRFLYNFFIADRIRCIHSLSAAKKPECCEERRL